MGRRAGQHWAPMGYFLGPTMRGLTGRHREVKDVEGAHPAKSQQNDVQEGVRGPCGPRKEPMVLVMWGKEPVVHVV